MNLPKFHETFILKDKKREECEGQNEAELKFDNKENISKDDLKKIKKIFELNITPLYGNQEEALEKIEKGVDRRTELLKNKEDNIVGVLVYKTEPIDEFASLGILNACEIKSLFLNNSDKNSGKGLGSMLLKKVEDYIIARNKEKQTFDNIVVTVSNEKKDSIEFFIKKGFQKAETFNGIDKYRKGSEEFLFYKKIDR